MHLNFTLSNKAWKFIWNLIFKAFQNNALKNAAFFQKKNHKVTFCVREVTL